jgi:hypothetical protein
MFIFMPRTFNRMPSKAVTIFDEKELMYVSISVVTPVTPFLRNKGEPTTFFIF